MTRLNLLRNRGTGFWVGVGLLAFVVAVGALGPYLAPHSPTETIGAPAAPRSSGAPLGTDTVGRDVLSRLLYGGRTVFALGLLSTAISYLIGITIGVATGYEGGRLDGVVMRAVDIALVIPTLLMALLAIVALGRSISVLVLVVGAIQASYVSRIVRAATMDVRTRPYVEAAYLRGERTVTIVRRDILPNITSPILADVGLRFAYAVILLATVNYLGLGLSPPASDWSLMIAENQQIINLNVWSVFAPAALLALLAVAVGLVSDVFARDVGRRRDEMPEVLDIAR